MTRVSCQCELLTVTYSAKKPIFPLLLRRFCSVENGIEVVDHGYCDRATSNEPVCSPIVPQSIFSSAEVRIEKVIFLVRIVR